MIALPAIDLREGACVQLVGGAYEEERVRLPDALEVAKRWAAAGFSRLHVVDLDAATGRGSNLLVLERLLAARVLPAQVGGGVRSEADIARLLSLGADRVVVGTRAVENPAWLQSVAHQFPGKLVIAADVRGRQVVTRGWQNTTAKDVLELVGELNQLRLGAVMVTAVHKEGQLQGTDLPLMGEVARACQFPVQASGGVTSMDDLRALKAQGIAGAIIGMALYTGALNAPAVAKEFGP